MLVGGGGLDGEGRVGLSGVVAGGVGRTVAGLNLGLLIELTVSRMSAVHLRVNDGCSLVSADE